jgi:uncharacterized membrane protein YkoI
MQQESTAKRRWRARAGIGLPVLLVALVLQVPAMAAGKADHRQMAETPPPPPAMREPPRPQSGLSEAKIIAIAEKRYNAKVMSVKETTINDRRVYLVRLMSKGKDILNRKLDAETGEEL